jgi:hypothetical protein
MWQVHVGVVQSVVVTSAGVPKWVVQGDALRVAHAMALSTLPGTLLISQAGTQQLPHMGAPRSCLGSPGLSDCSVCRGRF